MNKFDISQPAPTIVGMPGADGRSSEIRQNYDDSCAIRSQELVLRDFGIPVPEAELRQTAIENHWYTPNEGTYPEHIGNLLELYGVAVNRYEGASIFNLTSELAQGHKVIIGVDAGELWHSGLFETMEDMAGFQGADHALLVSGIDTSDPDNIKVIITDPGSGDVAKAYPIEQFVDAWQDSNCFMVTTADPAPFNYNPSMANFDYALGHIEKIGHLPYEDFQASFSACMDLDLSTSLLSDQAALLSQSVRQDDLKSPGYPSDPQDESQSGIDDLTASETPPLINDETNPGSKDSSDGHSVSDPETLFE